MIEEAKPKKKKGSYCKFKGKPIKPFNTEYIQIAEKLAASGAAQIDLAYIFGVSSNTLRQWKKDHLEFATAINRGAQFSLAHLIAKGIQKASCYSYEEVRTKTITDAEGNPTGKAEKTVTTKHQPADGALLMFLVENLDRKLGGNNWMRRTVTEVNGNVTHHVINGKDIATQIDRLGAKWTNAIEAEFDAKPTKPKGLPPAEEGDETNE